MPTNGGITAILAPIYPSAAVWLARTGPCAHRNAFQGSLEDSVQATSGFWGLWLCFSGLLWVCPLACLWAAGFAAAGWKTFQAKPKPPFPAGIRHRAPSSRSDRNPDVIPRLP